MTLLSRIKCMEVQHCISILIFNEVLRRQGGSRVKKTCLSYMKDSIIAGFKPLMECQNFTPIRSYRRSNASVPPPSTAIPEATPDTPTPLLAIKIEISRLTPKNVAQKCTAMGYPERKTWTQIFFSIFADFDNLG